MIESPHRRHNALTGEWILVSPGRIDRPWEPERIDDGFMVAVSERGTRRVLCYSDRHDLDLTVMSTSEIWGVIDPLDAMAEIQEWGDGELHRSHQGMRKRISLPRRRSTLDSMFNRWKTIATKLGAN